MSGRRAALLLRTSLCMHAGSPSLPPYQHRSLRLVMHALRQAHQRSVRRSRSLRCLRLQTVCVHQYNNNKNDLTVEPGVDARVSSVAWACVGAYQRSLVFLWGFSAFSVTRGTCLGEWGHRKACAHQNTAGIRGRNQRSAPSWRCRHAAERGCSFFGCSPLFLAPSSFRRLLCRRGLAPSCTSHRRSCFVCRLL